MTLVAVLLALGLLLALDHQAHLRRRHRSEVYKLQDQLHRAELQARLARVDADAYKSAYEHARAREERLRLELTAERQRLVAARLKALDARYDQLLGRAPSRPLLRRT